MQPERMGYEEALLIFERFGARLGSGGPAELRRAWIGLARRYHARIDEEGSGARAMAEINAAHDVLKRALKPAHHGGIAPQRDPRRQGVCVWAWAGHPGGPAPPPEDRIEMANDRDPNFVKRRIWLLSNGSQEEWTIWSFDGRRFLAPLTVYGSRRVFGEMACAALSFARVGFRRPRAVFVQRRGEAWADLLLLHSDGVLRPAIPFRHGGGATPRQGHGLRQQPPRAARRGPPPWPGGHPNLSGGERIPCACLSTLFVPAELIRLTLRPACQANNLARGEAG